MDKKQFTLVNRIIGIAILVISAFVYIATIEPTTSFWDCGEFIASSYKLEVGHPPGNPVFNLIAHIFTLFTADTSKVAASVNIMSALCSAFTIFFLYLTIVHFGRRIIEKRGKEMTAGNAVAVFGSGLVGAMAFCFSDTFWFSAVEGEVYAMSSLFTALVFWAILKWEEEADTKYADRWIVLISLLMGLSIGVHLLNLLAIPPIVYIYYYKKHNGAVSFWKSVAVLVLGGIILGFVLFFIIPYLPRLAAFFDRIFVNGFGARMNVGAMLFMIVLMALCFLALFIFRKKGKAVLHTATLCFTTILIGYSVFAVVIIRSCANTPTNEYQPDNPYTLVRYLGREQYGKNPIIYGHTFDAPYDIKTDKYYTPLDGKYYLADNVVPVYPADVNSFFPRMWNGYDSRHVQFYKYYCNNMKTRSVVINGDVRTFQQPSFGDNLSFFYDYQFKYMYMRYFMWNFVGRQNDIHGQIPGELICGNWESGMDFLDRARLGDQDLAPDSFSHNRGKNHYFFLPLILGLIGFFFQLKHDGRNCWVTALLFLLTGVAIVLYLNQPPYQVRERDYAYAGSFYVFGIWIGLGVLAIKSMLDRIAGRKGELAGASAAVAISLVVPVIMGCENWDDHDRSGRETARDMAYNYLIGLDKNAILVTHGDNDTFPLWYLQEVEGIRTDVRIVNTSLLGTDWYIDQMKCRQYESEPLPITIQRKQYLYGTNDFPFVEERIGRPVLATDAIAVFTSDKYKNKYGQDFIPAKSLQIPVDKEKVIANGLVSEKYYDRIVDTVTLNIEGSRFGKTDLIILDVIAHNDWNRPIYFITEGDIDLGLRKWMQYDGCVYKFVPVEGSVRGHEIIDEDAMYERLMKTYRFESLSKPGVNYDYQNMYTFCAVSPVRDMFAETAKAMLSKGEKEKALEIADRCIEIMPDSNFPYNNCLFSVVNEYALIDLIDTYLKCGKPEKAKAVADKMIEETYSWMLYFASPVAGESISKKHAQDAMTIIYMIGQIYKENGDDKTSTEILSRLQAFMGGSD